MQRKVTKQFVENSASYTFEQHPQEGYKTYSEEKTVEGVQQRWLLVYSEQAHQKAKKTVIKAVEKEHIKVKKALSKLSKQAFVWEIPQGYSAHRMFSSQKAANSFCGAYIVSIDGVPVFNKHNVVLALK